MTNAAALRAVIYTRQSKDGEGNGLAVARQLAECRKLAAARGWQVAREFEDNDTSASNGKTRPGFDAAMTMISEGRAGLLIVWAADRLVRKLADFERVIELFERTGAKLVTVSGDLDLSTDAGRLVGRILASVARGEVERKSARQKLAAQQSARAGKRWTGCPRPFGYQSDHLTPDPAESAAIQDAARMLLGGSTIAAVCRDWAARGFRPPQAPYGPLPRNPWSRNSVTTILRNPRLAGLAAYRGDEISLPDGTEAAWAPVLPLETWRAVDAMLGDPKRQRVRGIRSLLGGVARCQCGNAVSASISGAGGRIYRCVPATRNGRPGPHAARLAAPADVHVAAVAVAILSKPDAADLIAPRNRADVTALRERAAAIRATQAAMAGDAAEGLITRDEMLAGSARARARLAEIDAQLIEAGKDSVLAPLVAAESARAAWDALDLARKRAVLSALMSITLLPPGRGKKAFDPDTVRVEPVTPVSEPVKVKFTCTAGRQPEPHKPRLLGEAMVAADGSVTFESRGPSTARDGRGRPRRSNTFAKTDADGRDYAVYRMMCPSCPLHVEWRRERAETIARGAAESGKTTFDLSLMF